MKAVPNNQGGCNHSSNVDPWQGNQETRGSLYRKSHVAQQASNSLTRALHEGEERRRQVLDRLAAGVAGAKTTSDQPSGMQEK
jgi:hypothetical protein